MISADQPVPAGSPKNRCLRLARRAFRWIRIGLLAAVLFAVAILVWSNFVGVPTALSRLVTAELRRRNIVLEFSRLKLQGLRHIVAENLRLSPAGAIPAPRIEAKNAELLLDWDRLRRGEFEIAGLRLGEGQILVPINETNEAPRFVAVSNIVADVQFLPGDAVRVTRASAEAFGAQARAGGTVRNFSRFIRPSAAPAGGDSWRSFRRQLRDVADVFDAVQFSEPPAISIEVSGDALNPADWRGNIGVAAREARSQWGSFDRLDLTSAVYPARSNSAVAGRFSLRAGQVASAWGKAGAVRLEAESVWTARMDALLTNLVSFEVTDLHTPWGAATRLAGQLTSEGAASRIASLLTIQASVLEAGGYALGASEFKANLQHALPLPSPAAWFGQVVHGAPARTGFGEISGGWQWQSGGIRLQNSTFQSISVTGALASADLQTGSLPELFKSLSMPWELAVSNVLSEDIVIGSLGAGGRWDYPVFSLNHLAADLYGGTLKGTAQTDFAKHTGKASLEGEFDYQKAARLLDRPVQKWLQQFSWEQPPILRADLAFELPEAARSWEETGREIIRTLGIDGQVKGAGAFLGIPVRNAEGPFHFTNFVWRLPQMRIERPEGVSLLDYTGNVASGDFSGRLELRLDPVALRPLVPEEGRIAFDLVQFPQPPLIRGEAAGNWDRPDQIAFKGSFAVSNFVARGKPVGDIAGDILYSNLVLEAWHVTAHLGTGAVSAPYLRMDFPAEVLFVTNVTSTVDPYDAMHIVGPEPYDAIDPYRFAIPPNVTVNGLVPLRHVDKADLWFDVSGQQFAFWRFRLPQLSGTVHWRGHELWITNVDASFYRGRARWEGYFLINDEEDDSRDNADYRFSAHATDADLKLLVADVFGMTNQMEGLLTGTLTIDSANTENDKSWNGHGQATLRDGFLWNVPVFGIFTPVLDAIVPGGSLSRVTAGAGSFTITNSVVHTRDLQVRTKAFRLNYTGSVDLDGNLDALVEAEIFRDAWIFGKAVSAILWPVAKAFEARISGTAASPQTQLRYFPRFLLAPFRALSGIGKAEKPKLTPLPPAAANPGAEGLGPEDPRPPSP